MANPSRGFTKRFGRKALLLLMVLMQLLLSPAAFASSLAAGEGYVNYGGTKDIYSLPDLSSDIIGALPVGAPCDILSVSGDWAEIRTYTEMMGFFTGWVLSGSLEKAAAGDPVLPGNDAALPTPSPIPQVSQPPAPQETARPPQGDAYGSAVVKNPGGEPLRSAPSEQAESLGLYYAGAEAVCYGEPSQEWVYVCVGGRYGYMKSASLYWGDAPQSVPPQTPIAYVTNNAKDAWLNLRSQPSTQAEVLGKFYNGDRVTVIGQVDDWCHVKAGSVYGFMLSDYLALTDASPAAQTGSTRQYCATQYILRGYTLVASMTETAQNEFDLSVQIVVDPSVKLNAYPTGFRLYINGVKACDIPAAQDAANAALVTQFGGHTAFEYDISLLQVVPVDSDGNEILEESVFLK